MMRPNTPGIIADILSRRTGYAEVLDVGSYDVNGNLRATVESRGWTYTGLDITEGRNVDVVSQDPYHYPFADGHFDVVLSAYVAEHIPYIWQWVPELVRVLIPGGLLVVVTHVSYNYHPHPVDCWRIMPDGMKTLFDLCGNLENYEIRVLDQHDILGLAEKVQ